MNGVPALRQIADGETKQRVLGGDAAIRFPTDIDQDIDVRVSLKARTGEGGRLAIPGNLPMPIQVLPTGIGEALLTALELEAVPTDF